MSKRAIPAVAHDFEEVLALLKERAIVPANPPGAMLENAKRIHRAAYSLFIWRFRLTGLPDYGKAFIEEIASDALQILPQVMMGYGKTANLLIRGIIENSLRHLYFSDHPVEFVRMNSDRKWFMTMEALFEYPKTHPVFMKSERRFKAINRLSSLYSELSSGIHGRTVRDLEMRTALNKIKYTDTAARKQRDWVEKCAAAANFALAVFHYDKVRAFSVEDRRIILRSMPTEARKAWSEFGNGGSS
jgi:hypothetical protein